MSGETTHKEVDDLHYEEIKRQRSEGLFINYYRCPDCHHDWIDVWSAMCDDTCPECGCRNVTPYKSSDVIAPGKDVKEDGEE